MLTARRPTHPTEGQRLYAIGDVHGRLDLLNAMLARDPRRPRGRGRIPRPRIVMLGDYVDRGPDSRGVIEALIALKASPMPASFLLGNHDSYISAYLREPGWYDRTYHWLHDNMGGARRSPPTACRTRGCESPAATRDAFAAAFPRAHMAFLDACALKIRIGSYLFVHAGIRPGVPLAEQTRDDLIWIREPFLSSDADFGFKVVHGHTIVPQVEHWPNRIAVDTGAVRTGVLSCLVLEGTEVALLEPRGLAALAGGVRPRRPGAAADRLAEPLDAALSRGGQLPTLPMRLMLRRSSTGPPPKPLASARAGRIPCARMPAPRGVAQLVEHRSPKPRVVGSSPIAPASMRISRSAEGRAATGRGPRRRPPRSRWRGPRLTGSALAGARWKTSATRVAPSVMPRSRAMASIPPAAPERGRGAALSMARLFGDWKKPKPRPQSAMRQAMARYPASAGSRPAAPARRRAAPCRRRRARRPGSRSESRPAIGAASPSATGQGVIRRPVSTWSRPSALWKWKGSATKAMMKATKARSRRSPRARRPGSQAGRAG